MKVTGIIAEYNPFHKGHEYQLNYAKAVSDAVVVIMSGSFVQRGDATVFDKFVRAEAALKHGADLVLELPAVFALNTAERFAFGSIAVLDKLNIIDFLLFGSENGNIEELKQAAILLEKEPEDVSKKISALLDSGEGFAGAREKAFAGFIASSLLSLPNNILALEYLRQLYRRNSKILPLTHKRLGSNHHDVNLDSTHPSASAIRHAILNENLSYAPFNNSVIHRLNKLDLPVLYNIRKNKSSAFKDIFDVSEGIENRIVKAASASGSIEELVNRTASKRYTKSRIRRILLSSLLGFTADLSADEPQYIRVLGATKTGFSLLKEIKQNSGLDIVTKTADYKKNNNKMFEKDILATDIYDLTADISQGTGLDFKTSPIIIGG